jgi:hypothetical protein
MALLRIRRTAAGLETAERDFPSAETGVGWAYPVLGFRRACTPRTPRRGSRHTKIFVNPMNSLVSTSATSDSRLVLHRGTACLLADSIEENLEFTRWLNTWRRRLPFVSEDYGCGCCVHLFDFEAPKAAIEALPQELLIVSSWTENAREKVPRHLKW